MMTPLVLGIAANRMLESREISRLPTFRDFPKSISNRSLVNSQIERIIFVFLSVSTGLEVAYFTSLIVTPTMMLILPPLAISVAILANLILFKATLNTIKSKLIAFTWNAISLNQEDVCRLIYQYRTLTGLSYYDDPQKPRAFTDKLDKCGYYEAWDKLIVEQWHCEEEFFNELLRSTQGEVLRKLIQERRININLVFAKCFTERSFLFHGTFLSICLSRGVQSRLRLALSYNARLFLDSGPPISLHVQKLVAGPLDRDSQEDIAKQNYDFNENFALLLAQQPQFVEQVENECQSNAYFEQYENIKSTSDRNSLKYAKALLTLLKDHPRVSSTLLLQALEVPGSNPCQA